MDGSIFTAAPALLVAIAIAVVILLALIAAPAFNTSFVPGPIDEQLRLTDSVTKTADFNGSGLDLGQGYEPGGPGQRFSAVIDVSAMDLSDEDETYTFKVQQSANGSDWTDISPVVSFTGTGVKAIPVFVSARYVREVLDVNGTTPSITYEAWLVPHH